MQFQPHSLSRLLRLEEPHLISEVVPVMQTQKNDLEHRGSTLNEHSPMEDIRPVDGTHLNYRKRNFEHLLSCPTIFLKDFLEGYSGDPIWNMFY